MDLLVNLIKHLRGKNINIKLFLSKVMIVSQLIFLWGQHYYSITEPSKDIAWKKSQIDISDEYKYKQFLVKFIKLNPTKHTKDNASCQLI